MLWDDKWTDSLCKDTYPELFSFARKPKCSIKFFLDKDIDSIFFCPLSPHATIQLSNLSSEIENLQLNPDREDSWLFTWGTSIFSSTKVYKILRGTHQASPLFKWLWAAGNLGKHKFFFWLLLVDRLNTRDILKRKNRQLSSYNCAFCNSTEETCFHLFFSCQISTLCWNAINIHWDLNLPPLDMMCAARNAFNSSIFRELVITACWIIQKSRNAIIFEGKSFNLDIWKRTFREEVGLVCIKAKKKTAEALQSWCENFR